MWAALDGVRYASSKAEISMAWTLANAIASACIAPRITLLTGCWAVSDAPDVWTATLTAHDRGSWAPNSSRMVRAKIRRMARIFGHLGQDLHPAVDDDGDPGREVVDVEPPGQQAPHDFANLDEPEGDLVHWADAGVADEVRVFEEGVEARHVEGGELDRVQRQTHPQLHRELGGVGVVLHEQGALMTEPRSTPGSIPRARAARYSPAIVKAGWSECDMDTRSSGIPA